MDKSREQFEEWAINHKNHHNLPVFVFYKDHNGDYVDIEAKLAWQAWQASRAALVVELPVPRYRAEYVYHCSNDLEWDNYFEIEEVKYVLSEAGIKCS